MPGGCIGTCCGYLEHAKAEAAGTAGNIKIFCLLIDRILQLVAQIDAVLPIMITFDSMHDF